MSNSSFVNGLITGAGIILSIMSFGFLLFIAPVENQNGVSSTELRVAIFLGGLVAAASIGYEYYTKKQESKNDKPKDSEIQTKDDSIESKETSTESLDAKDELNE
jgi:hypothetical protein